MLYVYGGNSNSFYLKLCYMQMHFSQNGDFLVLFCFSVLEDEHSVAWFVCEIRQQVREISDQIWIHVITALIGERQETVLNIFDYFSSVHSIVFPK